MKVTNSVYTLGEFFGVRVPKYIDPKKRIIINYHIYKAVKNGKKKYNLLYSSVNSLDDVFLKVKYLHDKYGVEK